METLHKIAGITETDDATQQPSQRIPQPPPIPSDTDTAHRASLPLNRQPSHKSFRSSRLRDRSANPPGSRRASHDRHSRASATSASDSSDFAWGPHHPCFPHPNPHCDPSSPEASSTRVIRVRRDWLQAGDLYPQYANLYPEILDPLVTDAEFRALVAEVNHRVKTSFDPTTARARVDAVVGVVTGFAWDDWGFTGAKKGMRGLEWFLEGWNREKERQGKEVRVVQLRRTGFMSLDFVVPDPGIEATVGDGEAHEYGGGIGPAE